VGTRLVQLGLIFAAVLIITLAMSLVAQAVRWVGAHRDWPGG